MDVRFQIAGKIDHALAAQAVDGLLDVVEIFFPNGDGQVFEQAVVMALAFVAGLRELLQVCQVTQHHGYALRPAVAVVDDQRCAHHLACDTDAGAQRTLIHFQLAVLQSVLQIDGGESGFICQKGRQVPTGQLGGCIAGQVSKCRVDFQDGTVKVAHHQRFRDGSNNIRACQYVLEIQLFSGVHAQNDERVAH